MHFYLQMKSLFLKVIIFLLLKILLRQTFLYALQNWETVEGEWSDF